MKRIVPVLSLLLALVAGSARAEAAEASRCADCHFANPTAPRQSHLYEWDHSAHARSDVGCEKCHGGNATTFEPFLAHQGILNSRNPASPVRPANLPQTCGVCHVGPFVEFQKSKHYEMLRSGNEDAPTCSTCHGEVAAHLPSPKALESQCATCHGVGKPHARNDYPPQGKLLLEGVRDVRQSLNEAKALIRRVKDKTRKANFEQAYEQAEVPLIQAVHAGHQFVFDDLEERLGVARRRVEALLEQLANPAVR